MTNIMVRGRLGRDPMIRTTKNGGLMAASSVAVKPTTKAVNAPTLWFQLVAWDQVAEALSHYKKGHTVVVSGKLGYEVWAKDPGRGEWSITVSRLHDLDAFADDDFVPEVSNE